MRETWIVPDAQIIRTKKAYYPPSTDVLPLEGIIVHYTAGADLPLFPRVKRWVETPASVNTASTCIVVARNPELNPTLQLTPLEARAWHAGGSVLPNGQNKVNHRTLGVDFDNVGYLHAIKGKWFDAANRPYSGPKPFVDSKGEAWEPYQERAVLEMCRVLLMLGDLEPRLRNGFLLGHEDIRRTKRDPGPALEPYESALLGALRGSFPTGLVEV